MLCFIILFIDKKSYTWLFVKTVKKLLFHNGNTNNNDILIFFNVADIGFFRTFDIIKYNNHSVCALNLKTLWFCSTSKPNYTLLYIILSVLEGGAYTIVLLQALTHSQTRVASGQK